MKAYIMARKENDKKSIETETGISFLKIEISFTAFRSMPGRLTMPAAHNRSSRPSPRLRILPTRHKQKEIKKKNEKEIKKKSKRNQK